MPKFQKQPVMITAEYFDGARETAQELGLVYTTSLVTPQIQTKEGWLDCEPGCWIITGVQGERYPCDAAIFQQTYAPVDADGKSLWSEVYDEDHPDA